jgi:DNA repair exonuclease SbcCD ATPase subunit
MKLLKFGWRNICSYGNKLQELVLSDEPELILIEGKNGSGKSSIKEALTISMYGKSAVRKTKDIPNRRNKNAYTINEFISPSGDVIKIERGIDPNFTNLTINGESHNLPDKRKIDSFLEEELIQFPFSVFSNTISLSFEDFKSFIKLTPTDKRKIIDKIFGTDILTDISNVVKEDSKENNISIGVLKSDIDTNTDTLEKSKSHLSILKTDINIKKDIEISDKKKLISTKNKLIVDVKNKESKTCLELNKIKKKLSDKILEYSKNSSALIEIQKKLDIYALNKCPHCLSNLIDDDHIRIKDAIFSKKTLFENKKPLFEKEILNLSDNEKKYRRLLDSITKEESELYLETISLKNSIETLENNNSNTQTSTLEDIISDIKLKIKDSNEKLLNITKKQQILVDMLEIVSDSGIKQSLMDKIIPVLNTKILVISKKLEFKFSFEFDSLFNPIISHMGEEISPDSLSTGEQKKMNLIVLLAMLELIKMKNHQVNVLFLDEIFSSLDRESIYQTIEILKDFSKQHKLTVFVISHDPLPEELFNKKISIEKNNFFSEITIKTASEHK